jgi:hypothetical protein
LKPAQANNLRDPILKNPSQKRVGGVAQGVGPELKPPYHTCTKKVLKSLLEGFCNRADLPFVPCSFPSI